MTGDLRLAMHWAERLARNAVGAILAHAPNEAVGQRGAVAVLDTTMMLLIAVEIGLLKSIVGAATESLRTEMTSPASILSVSRSHRFPARVKNSLESFAAMLEFERESRAPVRTPPWFVTEGVLNDYGLALEEQLRDLLPWASALTADLVAQALTAHRAVEAAALSSRGLELAGRLDGLFGKAEKFADGLAADAKLGDDIVRPRWDWPGYQAQLDSFQEQTVEKLVETIGPLVLLQPSEEIPDYLGQAVHQAGEACFDALVTANETRFSALYKYYFIGILVVADRLRVKLADRHPFASIPWLAQPVIDLLTLSGYALIFAELHGTPELWHVARSRWDDYLNSADGQQGMEAISALVSAREASFAMVPGDLVRSWDGRLERKFSELPRDAAPNVFASGAVRHASPLVVALARGTFGMRGKLGLDVFVARYLVPRALRAGEAGVSFGGLERRIERIRELPQLESER
jgi:hypothetical protein